jgi:hypothetical protein
VAFHPRFPFNFAIMLGDNLYGKERPRDYENKFEKPYKPLLDAGVQFYAALGNHDEPNQVFYKLFNMNGERYYSFKAPKPGIGSRGGARFFALDSNYMDRDQQRWLEQELSQSKSKWKLAYFHHPIYSSGGRHGSEVDLRAIVEPLFIKYALNVVLSGHEHFYERLKPQKGIYYFISGGAAKLREGNIQKTDLTAKAFDTGYHFMLIELTKDKLNFQAITDQGKVIDSGSLPRFNDEQKKTFAGDAALPPPRPTATTGRQGR